MYKFKQGVLDKVFNDESIDKLVTFYNKLGYNIQKLTGIYDSRSSRSYNIDRYTYTKFREKYEQLVNDALFSEYHIDVVFNSLEDIDIFEYNISNVPEFYVIGLGDLKIVLMDLDCLELKPMTNLTDVDLKVFQKQLNLIPGEDEENKVSVVSSNTYDDLSGYKQKLQESKSEFYKIKKSIEDEQHEALETLRIEKERIMQELEVKKEALLAEMYKKELELKKKMYGLNKEIAIMDAQIYDIQSYLGETYELIQVRRGKTAPVDQPLTINQKIRFLDEDLPIIVGLYGNDFEDGKYENLLQAFEYSDKLVDYFCQTDKSITFFRISRDEQMIERFDSVRKNRDDRGHFADFCVKQVVNERGHDFVGFLLKNGENLYFGVLDVGKRIVVDDNVFCDVNVPEQTPDFNTMTEDQYKEYKKKLAKDRLARKFIFSIIQGLIDTKKVVTFDEPVSIFSMSPQILFSSASGRIETKRFGEFEWLKQKLNKLTRTGDHVFVHNKVNDANRLNGYFQGYQPSIDEIFGFHQISKVEINVGGKKIFIRTERQSVGYGLAGVGSHIDVYEREFINIEYMNSKWVDYFISIKAVDSTQQGRYFPIMIKNWMKIRDWLLKREEQVLEKIQGYYPDIEGILDWQVLLSEWRLQQKNPVREMTDFQVKRFVKALKEGTIKSMPFLYEKGYDTLYEAKVISAPEKDFEDDLRKIVDCVNKHIHRLLIHASKQPDREVCFGTSVRELISQNKDLDSDLKSEFITQMLYNEMVNKGLQHVFERIKDEDYEDIDKFSGSYRRWSISESALSTYKDDLEGELIKCEHKLCNLLAVECDNIKKQFGHNVVGNRDGIEKVIGQLENVLEYGIDLASDGEITEVIKKIIILRRDEDYPDGGFKKLSSARVGSVSMSPHLNEKRESLLKESGTIGVQVPTKDGYYDNFLVYDKSKLDRVLLNEYLNLLSYKYYLAVDSINTYPVFRVK